MGLLDRIVELLSGEDELTDLCHTAFAAYDEDESGSMDAKELHAAMKMLSANCEVDPPSKRKVRQICRRLEGDYEGEVEEADFVEFAKTWLTTYTEDYEEPEIEPKTPDEVVEILEDEDKLSEFAIDAFVDYDEDDSGEVNGEELHNIMTDLAAMLGIDAPSEDETKLLVYILEFDSDGEISIHSFTEIVRAYLEDFIENHCEDVPDLEAIQEWIDDEDKLLESTDKAFRKFDADGSGSMDAGELEEAFKELCDDIACAKPPSKKKLRRIIYRMDSEYVGELSIDDFNELVKAFLQSFVDIKTEEEEEEEDDE